jgi:hypothetical protein
MSAPPYQPHYHSATAIYIERGLARTEAVRVRDGRWVVRRNGRLVALDTIEPEPDALLMQSGFVENAERRRWSDLGTFLLDHDARLSADTGAHAGLIAA